MKKNKKQFILYLVVLLFGGLLSVGARDKESMDLSEAKALALRDAGIDGNSALFETTVLNHEGIYILKFSAPGAFYVYEIEAETGRIIESVCDSRHYSEKREDSGFIGLERAKALALTRTGLSESEALFKDSKLDREDHRSVYEIEIGGQGGKYEYTIDAVSGEIISEEAKRE